MASYTCQDCGGRGFTFIHGRRDPCDACGAKGYYVEREREEDEPEDEAQ